MRLANGSLRIGIVGLGNCASSFVQGLVRYRAARMPLPGLPNPVLGGYAVSDIVIASAFDVAAGKVGEDVARAILAAPNNTHIFAEVPDTGVTVRRGPTLDGLGRYLAGEIAEAEAPVADIAEALRRSRTEVLVSWLPVGAQRATEFYAEAALAAGCAFVNCIPAFIASDPGWAARFAQRGLPVIGDDIKSQLGATILHRALAALFRQRGVRLDRTYQLNFGGNTDFLNMLERDRLASKKLSKTRAVTSQMAEVPAEANVHVGPSDFVPWLEDRKWAYIRLEGTTFGDVPLNIEVKLEVWDSPNSAGIVMDAVRCAKLALDRGIGGALAAPSAWFMKSPPEQMDDHEAQAATLRFVAGAA
jgi:myo-inositol-1-phosphate synthase